MDKKLKQSMFLIAFAVLLFAAVMNLGAVANGVKRFVDLLLPILAGLLLAFVLSVPANGIERRLEGLFSRGKKVPPKQVFHAISLFLTLIILAAVIFLICTMAIPELSRTFKSIAERIELNWPNWVAALEAFFLKHQIDTDYVTQWVKALDIKQLLSKATSGAGVLIGSIADVAAATVSGISTALIACILAFYVLMSRDTLARQSKKVMYAYLKPSFADYICHAAEVIRTTYTKFLSGQCVEAIILGVLIYIAFSVFKLPYAGLVAMLTAVCALIPYVGAFISCVVSVFLALLVSPQKALLCIIVYLAVQFIETQLIYPHVVGTSVGLSPMWTLIASLIGGKLFGLLGVIFFIPLVASLYVLAKDGVEHKLQRKNLKL